MLACSMSYRNKRFVAMPSKLTVLPASLEAITADRLKPTYYILDLGTSFKCPDRYPLIDKDIAPTIGSRQPSRKYAKPRYYDATFSAFAPFRDVDP